MIIFSNHFDQAFESRYRQQQFQLVCYDCLVYNKDNRFLCHDLYFDLLLFFLTFLLFRYYLSQRSISYSDNGAKDDTSLIYHKSR